MHNQSYQTLPSSLFRFISFAALLLCFISFNKKAEAQKDAANDKFEATYDTQNDPTVSFDELGPISGNWVGTLTYLDYTSQKEVSIPCNLELELIAKKQQVKLSYIYPKEMKYNSTETMNLSTDGRHLDKSEIIGKSRTADGALRIVTQEQGTDNRQKATIQYVIVISASTFSIEKMVKPENAETFFRRNIYSWTKQ